MSYVVFPHPSPLPSRGTEVPTASLGEGDWFDTTSRGRKIFCPYIFFSLSLFLSFSLSLFLARSASQMLQDWLLLMLV